jgi:hypothetical protein
MVEFEEANCGYKYILMLLIIRVNLFGRILVLLNRPMPSTYILNLYFLNVMYTNNCIQITDGV